jgi:NTE family protein
MEGRISPAPPPPPLSSSASPVRSIPTDPPDEVPQDGIALCLSGGGYRAMLFHLGALRRLNEAGFLPRLKRLSSVSGGSITAGTLALAWPKLDLDGDGVARGFDDGVTLPLRRLASRTIDVTAVLHNLVAPGAASGHIAAAYRKYLFGHRTLQDLPPDDGPGAGPRFVFNGANLQTGALWRFSRPFMADYRVGTIPAPTLDLAIAVAVSSAAPPFLSPVYLKLDSAAYAPNSGLDLQRPPYTTRPVLTDGGVYDNLGLETAWKRYKTILVSDGGGHMGDDPRPHGDWPRQMFRVTGVIDNQVRSLRKRQVIDSYMLPEGDPNHRAGAYWGIRSDIANYGAADALPCPFEQTTTLADVATRLAVMPDMLQERLINWGYAVCDAALRRHVDPTLPPPRGFPYPAAGVGQEEKHHE